MKYLIVFLTYSLATTSTALPSSKDSNIRNGCSNDFCIGGKNGNYEHPLKRKTNEILQCINGEAYCQTCYPKTSVFSSKCNQCLSSIEDECVPSPVTSCPPQECRMRGTDFTGRIGNPNNSKEYIDCHSGFAIKCGACPGHFEYNEWYNACR